MILSRIMRTERIAVIFGALLLVAMLQLNCHSETRLSSQPSDAVRQGPLDKDLMKQVETLASSDATASTKAWEVLETYDRQNLISELTRLYRSAADDDYHKVLIDFTFCKLNHEYAAN